MNILRRFIALLAAASQNEEMPLAYKVDKQPQQENLVVQQVINHDTQKKHQDLSKKVSYLNAKIEKLTSKLVAQSAYIVNMNTNLEEILQSLEKQEEMFLEFDNLAIEEANKKDKAKAMAKEWFDDHYASTPKKGDLN